MVGRSAYSCSREHVVFIVVTDTKNKFFVVIFGFAVISASLCLFYYYHLFKYLESRPNLRYFVLISSFVAINGSYPNVLGYLLMLL